MKTAVKSVKKRKEVFTARRIESSTVEIDSTGNVYRDGKKITLRQSVELFKVAYEQSDGIDFGNETFAKWLDVVRDALPTSSATFSPGGAN